VYQETCGSDVCVPGRAVQDRTNLCSSSPENGNFSNFDQRLSAIIGNFDSIAGTTETWEPVKSVADVDFFSDDVGKSRETRLAGWGARIRTWEWRNQKLPDSVDLVAHFSQLRRKASVSDQIVRGNLPTMGVA
jgi:hypothetical protein